MEEVRLAARPVTALNFSVILTLDGAASRI